MGTQEENHQLLIDSVRGKRPWTDLHLVGIEIKKISTGISVTDRDKSDVGLAANALDIAQGFLTNLPDREVLMIWAFVLLSSEIDLECVGEEVEDDPEMVLMFDALADASAGWDINPEALALMRRLTKA